jgi:hypothetical protein
MALAGNARDPEAAGVSDRNMRKFNEAQSAVPYGSKR